SRTACQGVTPSAPSAPSSHREGPSEEVCNGNVGISETKDQDQKLGSLDRRKGCPPPCSPGVIT
ncbi:MAG: hypothetical protein Q6358_00370, partial [Candidatus Brocadiales bacterium]|nr:hypothetical protein [Candidatus Brocadiales bacterium]